MNNNDVNLSKSDLKSLFIAAASVPVITLMLGFYLAAPHDYLRIEIGSPSY